MTNVVLSTVLVGSDEVDECVEAVGSRYVFVSVQWKVVIPFKLVGASLMVTATSLIGKKVVLTNTSVLIDIACSWMMLYSIGCEIWQAACAFAVPGINKTRHEGNERRRRNRNLEKAIDRCIMKC